MPAKFIAIALSLCLLLGLTACGNKGPLTLPEQEDEKKQPSSE
ncbi:MAG: putative small lipoprotein YifL [Planctomycetota bacterium]|jgi:predicted small lipoprotein YifL